MLIENYHLIILMIEFSVILFSCIVIIALRLNMLIKQKLRANIREKLTCLITQALADHSPLPPEDIPRRFRIFEELLAVLESFNARFLDKNWQETKCAINKRFLLPIAEILAEDFWWDNRHKALRCFALTPLPEHQPYLLKLLLDKKFVNRIAAASCLIQLGLKDSIEAVTIQMSKESSLSRAFYQDAFFYSSKAALEQVEVIFKDNPDASVQLACLEILLSHPQEKLIQLIRSCFSNLSNKCRLVAIQILSKIPQHASLTILKHCLTDSSWEIRAEAAKALAFFSSNDALLPLAESLNDPIWWVRLQAALSLRAFGEKGVQLLSMQDPDINLEAYETAHYVLSLPY